MNEIKSKFKKLDSNCWYTNGEDISEKRSNNVLYYQPFDGCSITVNLKSKRMYSNDVFITIDLKETDNSGNEYLLYWWKYHHVGDIWKLATTAMSLINTYSYDLGNKHSLDVPNLNKALQGVGFHVDYEDVFYNGQRCDLSQ